MKTTALKFTGLYIVAMSIALISCENSSELSAASMENLIIVNADGNTLINQESLKSTLTGTNDLTPEQADWLKFVREEEKLARDLYLEFSKQYALPIFKNITRAEQNHMDAVGILLTTYGIEDPAANESGVFNNSDLQALYNSLLEKGETGLTDALKMGALVEETDISDVAGIYDLDPQDDLKTLAEALLLGSRNHLRAFNRVLKINGVVYAPLVLEQSVFDEIINSPWERGNGLCRSISQGGGRSFMSHHGCYKGYGRKG